MADCSDQDLPQRVMELLRIFLAASSRGEEAALVLETRKGAITTKYKSVETVAGVPVQTTNHTAKKRVNPARARRSKARLEEFTKNKVAEKKKATGDFTTSSPKKLILELSKPTDKPAVETRLNSPILQLDGVVEADAIQKMEDATIFYSFKSDYSEDKILESLKDIWPDGTTTITTLVLRQQLGSQSEDHLCTLRICTSLQNFSWPAMHASLVNIFREIRRI